MPANSPKDAPICADSRETRAAVAGGATGATAAFHALDERSVTSAQKSAMKLVVFGCARRVVGARHRTHESIFATRHDDSARDEPRAHATRAATTTCIARRTSPATGAARIGHWRAVIFSTAGNAEQQHRRDRTRPQYSTLGKQAHTRPSPVRSARRAFPVRNCLIRDLE